MRSVLFLLLVLSNFLNAMDAKEVIVTGFKPIHVGTLFGPSLSIPSPEIQSVIEKNNRMKGYNNLEKYKIMAYRDGDDLLVYAGSDHRRITDVITTAIDNLLKDKIGTIMYAPSTSIKSIAFNNASNVRYKYFFAESRIKESNITVDEWFELIDALINNNL